MLSDSEYFETCELKRNAQVMNELYTGLADFIFQTYNVEMINCMYDRNGKTPRLNIVVNTTEQFLNMHEHTSGYPMYNKKYQNQIAQKFAELVKAKRRDSSYSAAKPFIFFTNFENEAQIRANREMLKNHRMDLLHKYREHQLWNIAGISGSSTVFYFLDRDIEFNEQNGVSENLSNDYYQWLKPYDEFNYFNAHNFKIYFDSKENVDKNYEGNMYYYFK